MSGKAKPGSAVVSAAWELSVAKLLEKSALGAGVWGVAVVNLVGRTRSSAAVWELWVGSLVAKSAVEVGAWGVSVVTLIGRVSSGTAGFELTEGFTGEILAMGWATVSTLPGPGFAASALAGVCRKGMAAMFSLRACAAEALRAAERGLFNGRLRLFRLRGAFLAVVCSVVGAEDGISSTGIGSACTLAGTCTGVTG